MKSAGDRAREVRGEAQAGDRRLRQAALGAYREAAAARSCAVRVSLRTRALVQARKNSRLADDVDPSLAMIQLSSSFVIGFLHAGMISRLGTAPD